MRQKVKVASLRTIKNRSERIKELERELAGERARLDAMGNESLNRFAATEVMGWSADSAAARDFHPTESWTDAGRLWEKARERGMYFALEGNGRAWLADSLQNEDVWRDVWRSVKASTGPAALTKVVCRELGWKREQVAAIDAAREG